MNVNPVEPCHPFNPGFSEAYVVTSITVRIPTPGRVMTLNTLTTLSVLQNLAQ